MGTFSKRIYLISLWRGVAGTVGAVEGGSVGERSRSKGRCGAGVTGTVGDGTLVDIEVPVGIINVHTRSGTNV